MYFLGADPQVSTESSREFKQPNQYCNTTSKSAAAWPVSLVELCFTNNCLTGRFTWIVYYQQLLDR